jgi:hypothetical protein
MKRTYNGQVFRVNDRVYHRSYGWGAVTRVTNGGSTITAIFNEAPLKVHASTLSHIKPSDTMEQCA